jgi:hypothetical protein
MNKAQATTRQSNGHVPEDKDAAHVEVPLLVRDVSGYIFFSSSAVNKKYKFINLYLHLNIE